MDDILRGVEQTPHALSSGSVDLPLMYSSASQFGAFFRVSLDKVAPILEGKSVEAWPIAGKALVAVYVWEYRESTVGTYNEVGLGIQCRRRGTKPSILQLGLDMLAQDDQGIWVVDLPVTTQEAYTAGVELWGYPKYVSPIDIQMGRQARARLGDELTLTVGGNLSPPVRGLPVVTYTDRKGSLIRTAIRTDVPSRWGLGGDSKLEVTGDGPMARSLRSMGLENEKPFAVFRGDHFRAVLPAGVELGSARA